jgi:hypothetical protein
MGKFLLGAGAVILVQLIPVRASADCGGILPWLCFNAEPTAAKISEEAPQGYGTRYSANKPKSGGSARSRNRRQTSVAAAAASSSPSNCLSRVQVQGGYPRYRVINGRHCWYASADSPRSSRTEININPHDDPIWKTSDPTRFELADCEVQALKLDDEEKKTFMKECISNVE